MPLFDQSTTSAHEELRLAHESIAQSIGLGLDTFKHYTGKLLDLLPSISRSLKASADQSDKYPKIAALSKSQQDFMALIAGHNYLELREIKAYTQQGFIGTFLGEATELNEAVQYCMMIPRILDRYTTYLAHLVGSGNTLASAARQGEAALEDFDQRKKTYDALRAMFRPHSTATRAKLGDVVERNNDWPILFFSLSGLVQALERIDRRAIDDKVKQASDYLDILYQRLSKGEIANASPEVAQELSKGAYEIACDLEYFGSVYFWVLGLQGAVSNTLLEVERVLKS